MKKLWVVGVMALSIVSGAALAQDAASSSPGGLAARDVEGKRLLDANGSFVGRIESANPQEATVRTPDGKRITVDMAKLSLGNGPHTVIEESDSDANKLNASEADNLNQAAK